MAKSSVSGTYTYLYYLMDSDDNSDLFFGLGQNSGSTIHFWRENVLGETYYTTGASTFTVTWKDANGSVIETDTGVQPGSHPSFDGTTPTKPADGTYTYTFAGWKVEGTSGNTTVDLSTYTVTGNVTFVPVFTATEIPTVTYTVTYKANGSVINTENVAAASTVTLPATAPAATGYEFIGWMTFTLEETTNEPAYKAPGAVSDPINADTTFYALYRRTEGTTETVFELLTSVPQNVPGTYVISSGATTSDYMLSTRRTGTYESASYTTLISDAEATISVENGKTIMRNVPADNQFTFAAGSESGYYTIVNNSGSYLYIADPSSTSAYYLAARASYTNTYSLWGLEYTDGVFHVGSYSNTDRVIHYSTTATLFGLYSVSGNSTKTIGVQLWKQTEIASGETYYTTETGSTHKLTVNYVVPNGYTAPESFVSYYGEGDTYNVESPVIEGLTPDRAIVNGEMGSEDVTVTVTYSVTPTFTLTIEYIGPVGDENFQAPASAVMQVAAGAAYSVGSPWVYGYQADQEVVSGTMPNENKTIRVYYTKVDMGDKTYTITLYAVYGRANTEGNTHIYWYSNDYDATETSGGRCHEDILDVNEPVAIPEPESFTPGVVDWTQTNPSVLPMEGGAPLVWADHIFLGWARVEAALDDITGKAHPELSDADLYLKWVEVENEENGGHYEVETKDGWTSVDKVAADEMQPYHDMYAVWADVFYVYHSGTNAVERVVRTSRSTTYNLARTVSSGMLYGGYYKAYAGMSANFNIKNDPAWEDVSVDRIIASYRGIVRQTSKTVDGESVLYKDNAGTAYDGVNVTWNWDDSYNIDTVTTQGAAKAADPHGNAIKPVAGETYFIKEVPADTYLMPHLHFTYYGSAADSTDEIDPASVITRFWLVSNIDDINYQQGGFTVTDGDDTVLYSSTDYVSQLTIRPDNNPDAAQTITPNGLFGAEGGYLTYKRFETSELHEGMVLRNYWVTPDGMIVLGANKITLGNTANVGSLVSGTEIEIGTRSTVSVFANNAN
ncbi:MAG: InlB B-repeat-containing protein [Clostridia bacterium]|nr:InlB B-repeat-containing protein [Clostridia bacterium]